jgi:hypothetical protein
MLSNNEWQNLEQAKGNDEFRVVRCFDPPSGPSPWPHSICVIELLPPSPDLEVILGQGWAEEEDWGIWAEGTESHTVWIATGEHDYAVVAEAFPMCVPDRKQQMSVEVNGTLLDTYEWPECAPWSGRVAIPADLVHIGENELVIRSAYAARPVDVTGGANGDERRLSVGFTRLDVEPAVK